MKHAIPILIVGLVLATGCAKEQTLAGDAEADGTWQKNIASFSEEVQDLQKQLRIPGLAFAIVEDGRVLASQAFGSQIGVEEDFTTSTPVNTQSITKSFAAILAMQLVSEGQLDLTSAVREYSPESGLPTEIQVEHLLTHTSEGVVGEQYIYSGNRYSLLKEIVEQAGGATLEEQIRTRIIEPASMNWHDSPGMGTAWGLISTVDDLRRFAQALDHGDLLAPSDLQRLATPTTLLGGVIGPISLGWFAQEVQGVPVMWGYGQGADREDSSALVFRIPERKLTAILLANTNTMSDWFRLLMGDAEKSAFAMSFYRLFVASEPGEPLPRPDWRGLKLDQELEANSDYSYEGELVAQILDLPNQQPDFLHRLFKSWSWLGLAEAYRDSNPALAQKHLRELIACVDCPNHDQATAFLEDLDADGSDFE